MAHEPELETLRDLIVSAHAITTTIDSPAGHSATEKLGAAVALVVDLKDRPAAALGKRGGLKTAERGPDYFKKIAGMRKTNAGGRPKKSNV